MLIALFLLWIAFNGRVTPEVVLIGVLITLVLYVFCAKFLGYRLRQELDALRLLPRALAYVGLLMVEIGKASLLMIRIVLNPKREVQPRFVTFYTPLTTSAAQSVLANSITLTPGTISVLCEGSKLTVHCLDSVFAEGIENLVFQQKLLWLERLGG